MAQLRPTPANPPGDPAGRISQLLPSVKCSNCNQPVPLDELGDHTCRPTPPVPTLPEPKVSPSAVASLLPQRLQGRVAPSPPRAKSPVPIPSAAPIPSASRPSSSSSRPHRVQADPRRVRVLVRVDPRLVAPRLLLLMEGPSISQRRAHYLVLNPSPNLPPLTTQALVRHAPAPTAVHELYPPPDLSHPMPLLLLLPALHTPRLRLRWLQPKSSPSHRLVRNRTRLVLKPSNLIPRQVEKPVWPA